MRIPWNKRTLNRNDMLILRKMYFQKKLAKEITEKTGLSYVTCSRIYNEHNWYEKRERYYRYLCYLAYTNGMSISKICSIAGCPVIYAVYVKRKYKISTKTFAPYNKRITKNIEDKMVIDYFNGVSSRKLAKKYGFKTGKTVTDVLNKNKISFRHPTKVTNYNTDYFEKIDSHDKAYILGLILTDGYIIKNYNGFAIQLTESDGYLLKKIAKRLGPSSVVSFISCDTKRRTIPGARDMMRLNIHNQKISQNLKSLGVTKNKTYDMVFKNNIPDEFFSAFCRGLWDGDGTFNSYNNKGVQCKIGLASLDFLIGLSDKLDSYGFKNSLHTNNNFHMLNILGGKHGIKKFLKWMYYEKGDLYLRRKYEKMQNKINKIS